MATVMTDGSRVREEADPSSTRLTREVQLLYGHALIHDPMTLWAQQRLTVTANIRNNKHYEQVDWGRITVSVWLCSRLDSVESHYWRTVNRNDLRCLLNVEVDCCFLRSFGIGTVGKWTFLSRSPLRGLKSTAVTARIVRRHRQAIMSET